MELWEKAKEGYEVSSLGRVRSYARTITKKDGKEYSLKGQILSANRNIRNGYLSVQLGAGNREYVHRLVAIAFVQGFDDGMTVNHKNGVRDDNRAENLEWVTQGENVAHSFRELGRKHPALGKSGALSKSSKRVVRTDLKTGERVEFASCGEAGRNGFDVSTVAKCCRGECKQHKGYAWSYP